MTTSPRLGSRTAGSRLWRTGTSAPYSSLLTNRKSPTSRVFSMLPEGIRNASTRKVRRDNQTTRAKAMDLIHTQAQWTNPVLVVFGIVTYLTESSRVSDYAEDDQD